MKAFIFDMDGVLIDTEPVHHAAEKEVFAHYGILTDDAELATYAGTTHGWLFEDISRKRGVEVPLPEAVARKDQLFFAAMERADLQPIPGIPQLLRRLRALGVKMAIASSSSDAFIASVVDRLQIRSYFDVLVSGENLPKSKPYPAIYTLTARRLGVRPRDCVVLEDAAQGVQAAKGAGMYCIGFDSPDSYGGQDLSLADRIVQFIDEIDVENL